jgi:hypothetical protein
MVRVGGAAIAVFALFVLVACGGESFSTKPSAYIPEKVGGSKVSKDESFGKSLQTSLSAAKVKDVSSGIVQAGKSKDGAAGGGQLPELLLVAMAIPSGEKGSTALVKEVQKQLQGGGKAKSKKEDVGGVEAQVFTVKQGSVDAVIAIASPTDGIGVMSYGFRGDRKKVVEGLVAMIESGKQ